MSYFIETRPNASACQEAAMGFAQDALRSGQKPIIIVPTYSHQLAVQRALAEYGMGFGVGVSTPLSWIEELWDLFGNGLRFIDSFGRVLELKTVIAASGTLPESPGLLNLLGKCAWEAMPFIDAECNLSEREEQAMALLKAYRDHLRQQGLMELSEAACILAETAPSLRFKPILLGFTEDDLSVAYDRLFSAFGSILVVNGQTEPSTASRNDELVSASRIMFKRKPGDAPVAPQGALRIALASGPSASNRLACDQIAAALEAGCESIVVVSAKPAGLFDYAAPLLDAQGISCRIDACVKLKETDMGRALLKLGELTANVSPDPLDATPLIAADFAYNPFSGLGKSSAFRIDKLHRRDRLTKQDDILSDLASSASDSLSGLINRIEERRYDEAAEMLQDHLNARFAGKPAYYAEQCRALATFDDTWPRSSRLPLIEVMEIIAESTLPVSAGSSDQAQVRFVSQSIAASLPAGSVDCVIFAGMSAEEQPIKNPEDALHTLLGKLGVAKQPDPLAKARTQFYEAFEAARKLVILERPLNDSDGNPSQPATVFEEAIDCYRQDLHQDIGIDKTLGIPESLVPLTSQLGEQDVLRNAGARNRGTESVPAPATGAISDDAKPLVVLPHLYGEGIFDGLDVSPSQIESYLDCPYCWFAKRRLKLEDITETFSPKERGTFMHDILCRFYVEFQNRVGSKVTLETIDQARQIMEEAFEHVCQKQYELRPGSRYIPLTPWEHKERQAVLRKLKDYLSMEADLLPSFTPRYFEWQFASNRPFPYAGCNLRGTIDRIDVDEFGNAVVIDYKSSLSDDYRLYDLKKLKEGDPFQLPKKTQALMYAKAVQELLGFNVVATLYVNPLKKSVLGAYDAHVLGPADIPFGKKTEVKACQVPYPYAQTIPELISICEREIERRLEGMAEGRVEPNPASEQACAYCPVNVCEHRLAPRSF